MKTKKIVPMNQNVANYKRTQLIIIPPRTDANIKPHEIFEGMKKVKKKKKEKIKLKYF